jgi:alkylated DNA repair protein alkB family protein 1
MIFVPVYNKKQMDDDIRDPSSSAYKRARRRHIKTTRNRPTDVDQDWTPFRAAEKRYKARFPPPDLSHVLDLATITTDARAEEECLRGGWRGSSRAVQWNEIHLDDSEGRKGYIIPRIPGNRPCFKKQKKYSPLPTGLVLLPAFVSHDKQRSLVRVSLRDQACYPNETNLDTHYDLPIDGLWRTFVSSQKEQSATEPLIQPRISDLHPEDLPGPRKLIDNVPASPDTFSLLLSSAPKPPPPAAPSTTTRPTPPSVLLKKLRWANMGWSYHWGSKQYDFGRGKGQVRAEFRDVCKEAVKAVPWGEVFGEISSQTEWDGDDWRTWHDTYGKSRSSSSKPHIRC